MGKGTALMLCPLCQNISLKELVHTLRKRDYFLCPECDLVFADPQKLLEALEEKKRYAVHENHKRDPGYLNFLGKLLIPLKPYISKKELGLDYGSGPYPMLATLMREEGYKMDTYDPLFEPLGIKEKSYDYITSTEVVEHFYNPLKDLSFLLGLLKSSGKLAVMTSLRYPEIDFKKWYYIQDDTHVSFYSPKTMEWIADKFNLKIIYIVKNVIIFEKN